MNGLSELLEQGKAAERDRLTGLDTLSGALERVAAWQADSVGRPAYVHAMLIGLRRFDTINLAYGEATGDSALVEVAKRILHFAADEFEGNWAAARAGGGNFLIAVNEASSRERWQWMAEALMAEISRPIANQAGGGTVRLWPRVAMLRSVGDETAPSMVERLAETLSGLQTQSVKRLQWADGRVTIPGRSSAQLEADLLGALDRDEIEIFLQPQYSATTNAVVGAEALARWDHPDLGRIGAAALFAIAERADHLVQLSHHIAERALAVAARWPERLRLSLNVTAADLSAPDYADQIVSIVMRSGFSLDRLTLEITEQALVADLDRSAQSLARLVELGVRIALDDFGAGFCNFRYLKLLPLHTLKLDRAMVDGIGSDPRDLAVFRAIVAMARALDLTVIAEGVETEEQRALIASEGCELYQGFLGAKPMASADFLALVRG